MPRNTKQIEQSPGMPSGIVIHQRITEAARLFTQQILHILGSSTLAELTALTQGGAQTVNVEAGRGMGPGSAVRRESRPPQPPTPEKKKVLDFLLSIGKMPVKCPVPSCTDRGIRSKNNFCQEHYKTLPKAEQQRLRDLQKKGQHENKLPAPAPAPAPVGRRGRSKGEARKSA